MTEDKSLCRLSGDTCTNLVDAWGLIAPQVRIGEYRVDFLVVHWSGLDGFSGIVVECDGHQFHEKTKEQVARDKERDRFLQERGYKVLRFAGSEIWRNAFSCAMDVLAAAESAAWDSSVLRHCARNGDWESLTRFMSPPRRTPPDTGGLVL